MNARPSLDSWPLAWLVGMALLVVVGPVGCSSASSNDGGPKTRHFDEPFEALWEAARHALRCVEAEVIGENERQGVMVGAVDFGRPFGEAELALSIRRPQYASVLDGWEVTVSGRPPPGAKGGQGWEEIIDDLEDELMTELWKAASMRAGAARPSRP